jgi:hypothetical protein
MGFWSVAAAPLANVAAGLLGAKGQRDANRQTAQLAREQMQFQERMSSTAYQRAADDMEAAGLNRILALGSPATTPSGARAVMQNPNASIQQGIGEGVHSALASKRLSQELQNMRSVQRRDDTQANLNTEAAILSQDQQRNIQQQTRESIARTQIASAQAQIQNTIADTYEMLGPAFVAMEKIPFIGQALGTLGRNMMRRQKGRRTETTKVGPHGEYRGGTVTTSD